MSSCLCLDCKKEQKLESVSAKARAENRRTKLTELIQNNPGIHFRDLMRLTNLKNGALNHHLRRLEKSESIKAERLPRQTRFYPRNFPHDEAVVAKELRRMTPRDIICLLLSNDMQNKYGLDFSEIVYGVSKSPSTVSSYLSQLIDCNIVTVTRDFGRKKRYHLSNIKLVKRLIEREQLGILEKPVSGFEDMINSL